jgi:hypothetical protein
MDAINSRKAAMNASVRSTCCRVSSSVISFGLVIFFCVIRRYIPPICEYSTA